MTTYYETARERAQRANALAASVRLALPDGPWTIEPNDDNYVCLLDGPGGAQLGFSLVSGRVVVRGHYPQGTYDVAHNIEHVEISIAAERGAAVLAREIIRRLLPKYLPLLADVNSRLTKRDTDAAKRKAAVERLAKLAPGGSLHERTPDEVDWRLPDFNGYGRVHVNYHADTVSFEANSLPIELAAKILTLLREGESN